MKKAVIYFILLFISTHQGIKAQAQFANVDSVKNYLVGGWDWKWSSGGFSGAVITPTSPGRTTAGLRFTKLPGVADSIAYTAYNGGTITAMGHARITSSNTSSGLMWNLTNFRYIGGAFLMSISLFDNKADTVLLADNCSDCYYRTYVRSKTVGIKTMEQVKLQIGIYPNPVVNQIRLGIPAGLQINNVFIYDLSGKCCDLKLEPDNYINASGLLPGIYHIKCLTSQGEINSKFIKD